MASGSNTSTAEHPNTSSNHSVISPQTPTQVSQLISDLHQMCNTWFEFSRPGLDREIGFKGIYNEYDKLVERIRCLKAQQLTFKLALEIATGREKAPTPPRASEQCQPDIETLESKFWRANEVLRESRAAFETSDERRTDAGEYFERAADCVLAGNNKFPPSAENKEKGMENMRVFRRRLSATIESFSTHLLRQTQMESLPPQQIEEMHGLVHFIATKILHLLGSSEHLSAEDSHAIQSAILRFVTAIANENLFQGFRRLEREKYGGGCYVLIAILNVLNLCTFQYDPLVISCMVKARLIKALLANVVACAHNSDDVTALVMWNRAFHNFVWKSFSPMATPGACILLEGVLQGVVGELEKKHAEKKRAPGVSSVWKYQAEMFRRLLEEVEKCREEIMSQPSPEDAHFELIDSSL